jgi:hypothetical protein
MTNLEIGLRRLRQQRITGAGFRHPEEVASHMGALQAQDYMQAMWAIALRTRGSTLADVQKAIAERLIVLTWAQRGTIHAVHREHVRAYIKLTAPRLLRQAKTRQTQLELDERVMDRSRAILKEALQGGGPIERSQLLQRLEEHNISTGNQRGYHILWHNAHEGHICFGPMSGKQQTFVWLDDWIPPSDEPEVDFATELAVVYYASHGPATVQDFAWWSGMTLTDARKAVAKAGDRLQWAESGGERYGAAQLAQEADSHSPSADKSVRLLPGFDEFLLGYKDRSAVLQPEYAARVVPGNNGVFQPTIVVDGQIAGLWKRTIKSSAVDISFVPFYPLGGLLEQRLMEEAERYAAFMERPLGRAAFV